MKNKQTILDNTNTDKSVGKWLKSNIQDEDTLRFVSAYFTIYGFKEIQAELENTEMRFLFGDPSNVGEVDPKPDQEKAFKINNNELQLREEEEQIKIKERLARKWLAEDCMDWVSKETTQIKTIIKSNFLHGKMYHLKHANVNNQAVSGSSNFTQKGLGLRKSSNIEINLIANEDSTKELATWFDLLWNNSRKVKDAKDRVMEALEKLGKDQTPEFIYFKTLFHLFEERLRKLAENEELLNKTDYRQTAIWKELYSFQEQGAKGALSRLTQYNGCIIADSVGLGKTYTALAVIKYYELRQERVLVLCPKRLRENWTRYLISSANPNNPLEADRFGYHVLSHTDLSRESGKVGDINLETLDWGNYSLIVIDESHNFRNIPSKRKIADGVERISRYELLLKKVINDGIQTKVLMLSATPVNNTLKDLANQIRIISGGDDQYFNKQGLGITSVKNVMQIAQRRFTDWQKKEKEQRTKKNLIDDLSSDFFRLLDELTIARSRKHIARFYKDDLEEGGFPKRNDLVELHPPTDSENVLSYKDMAERIVEFKLAIYHPADYILSDSDLTNRLEDEKKKYHYTQKDRERHLIQMMRVIFLKRLESSVEAYRLTIGRTKAKIENTLKKINSHKSKENTTIDSNLEPDVNELEDEEDYEEDYVEGGKVWRYRYKDLDLDKWEVDLKKEMNVLSEIFEIAKQVTPERDAKLAKLREKIYDKLSNPTINKCKEENRKVLIFTTYADTAKYLYKELESWAKKQKCHIAQIAGSDNVRTSVGKPEYQEILDRFAPKGREAVGKYKTPDETIDILIATDCISEGQNLQDCDTVINFDIHWNPVRLIQRFGRIDRLRSDNEFLNMINFWPPIELDEYLKLRAKVSTRMEIANIAATGDENILNPDEKLEEGHRYKQIQKDLLNMNSDQEDGIQITDFTQDDFLAELKAYIDMNSEKLENASLGLFAVTNPTTNDKSNKTHANGAIFCLQRKQNKKQKKAGKILPCHLIYIDDNLNLYAIDKSALPIMRGLSRDRDQVISKLARKFDKKTNNGKTMSDENKKIEKAIEVLQKQERKEEGAKVSSGNGKFDTIQDMFINADDYNLISWLVIAK